LEINHEKFKVVPDHNYVNLLQLLIIISRSK